MNNSLIKKTGFIDTMKEWLKIKELVNVLYALSLF